MMIRSYFIYLLIFTIYQTIVHSNDDISLIKLHRVKRSAAPNSTFNSYATTATTSESFFDNVLESFGH